MLDTTHADAISVEEVAFLADALPKSTEWGCIFGCIPSEGGAFPTTGTRFGCISNEGVAFSTPDGPMVPRWCHGGLLWRRHTYATRGTSRAPGQANPDDRRDSAAYSRE